jgi:hypothetical protein
MKAANINEAAAKISAKMKTMKWRLKYGALKESEERNEMKEMKS